jgi:death-on-curing protein
VKVHYPDLADYLAIAAAVIGIDVRKLSVSTKLGLADSALHAPSASLGDQEFYPDFCDKAAVLLVPLVKNHPLLDGNKRAAWVTLRVLVEVNSWRWVAYPSVDEAEEIVLAIADGGRDEEQVASWLRAHIEPAKRSSTR